MVCGVFCLAQLFKAMFKAWCVVCSAWPSCSKQCSKHGVLCVLLGPVVQSNVQSMVCGVFCLAQLFKAMFKAWCVVCSAWPSCSKQSSKHGVLCVLLGPVVQSNVQSMVCGVFCLAQLFKAMFKAWCVVCSAWPSCSKQSSKHGVLCVLLGPVVQSNVQSMVCCVFCLAQLFKAMFKAWCVVCSAWPSCSKQCSKHGVWCVLLGPVVQSTISLTSLCPPRGRHVHRIVCIFTLFMVCKINMLEQ